MYNPEYKKVLLVGSETRKSGKTHLICKILQSFSSKFPIVGIKISIDEHLNDFQVIEDKEITKEINDTQRMLKAGAQKAFYIKANSEVIGVAFNKLIENIGNQFFILCESLTLRKYINPAVFIAIENGKVHSKSRFNKLKQFSDLLVYSYEVEDFNLENIPIENGSWVLKKSLNH